MASFEKATLKIDIAGGQSVDISPFKALFRGGKANLSVKERIQYRISRQEKSLFSRYAPIKDVYEMGDIIRHGSWAERKASETGVDFDQVSRSVLEILDREFNNYPLSLGKQHLSVLQDISHAVPRQRNLSPGESGNMSTRSRGGSIPVIRDVAKKTDSTRYVCIKIQNLSSTFRKCSEQRTYNNTTPHSPRNKKRSIKRKIYPRENLNRYIQSQTTRKFHLFHGDLPITEMHRGTKQTSYIPFLLNPETRSDIIPVRLHFRETIPQARQPISHRRVCVNNRMARYVVLDRKGEGNIIFIILLAGSKRRRASRAQDTGKPVIEQSSTSSRLLA
ncbi:unnamed protein product [Lupinus luteus]|uniref:Uncharacterized protein n=1 Tax=Lupinus luteus TaxID=3873 RepID=A0AAV1XTU7_LUPLU